MRKHSQRRMKNRKHNISKKLRGGLFGDFFGMSAASRAKKLEEKCNKLEEKCYGNVSQSGSLAALKAAAALAEKEKEKKEAEKEKKAKEGRAPGFSLGSFFGRRSSKADIESPESGLGPVQHSEPGDPSLLAQRNKRIKKRQGEETLDTLHDLAKLQQQRQQQAAQAAQVQQATQQQQQAAQVAQAAQVQRSDSTQSIGGGRKSRRAGTHCGTHPKSRRRGRKSRRHGPKSRRAGAHCGIHHKSHQKKNR